MKLNVAILGSTGSIGKSLLKIISKDKKKFKIWLLTAHKNYKLVLSQAKKFGVKNIIITNKEEFKVAKVKNKNKKVNIYNNFNNLEKIFKKKIDYVMSAIVGLDGLDPTYRIIPHTNRIAIANKETIICAWHLIKKKLKKYNTEFVPVDSEHFSIWYSLKNNSKENIETLYLTASGGPLLKIPLRKFKNLKISKIIQHPNWKMGSKISVDSATMMNKVFEVIEAKKIFDLNYKQISILIHPKSYIHAILKYRDGMIDLIAHETTMEIPIFNSLPLINKNKIKTNKLDLNKINNLELSNVKKDKFPFTRLLNLIPNTDSLFETVLVSTNDYFVKLFLQKKISYLELIDNIFKFVNKKHFVKYKFLEAKKIADIFNLNKQVISMLNNNKHY